MRYRTKIYLILLGLALFSTLLALGIVLVETRGYFFKELQSKVMAIAETTASAIDPEALKQIHTRSDEASPFYALVQNELRKARDANRNKSTYVKYVYTMMPSPIDPNTILFGVDAEENTKNFSHVGDVNPDIKFNEFLKHQKEAYASDQYEPDPWGVWLTGYAPVFDKNGEYVGSIGADIDAAAIRSELNKLIFFGLTALFGSLAAAALSATFLATYASSSLKMIYRAIKQISGGNLDVITKLKTNDEFSEVASAINEMAKGLKERERLKSCFSRYVSSYVLEKVISSEMPLKLEGERRKVTLLFSDLRHFTLLAEKLSPEKVVSLLNEYFDHMLEAIFSNQGTLDKFIGDGLMVEFGAPLEDHEQEMNAIRSAIEMQKKLKKLNNKWAKQGKPQLEMGIGIHTGQAIVGNIGSEERMQYTAVGDTVNIAARLELSSKMLNLPIVVSEETYKAVKDVFPGESLGKLALAGREGEIAAYSILI